MGTAPATCGADPGIHLRREWGVSCLQAAVYQPAPSCSRSERLTPQEITTRALLVRRGMLVTADGRFNRLRYPIGARANEFFANQQRGKDVTEIPVALDGIAPYIHEPSPIQSLS